MLSKQNRIAVCLGLAIAVTALLCQRAWIRIVVVPNPSILLVAPLEGPIIIGGSGPVLFFSLCLSYLAFWYAPPPRKVDLVLTTLIVLVAFPLLFLGPASPVENILRTLALIGGTVMAIVGGAVLARKYPRHHAT